MMEYLLYIPMINAIASFIVAATPTKKDDGFYRDYLRPLLEILAGNVGHAGSGTPESLKAKDNKLL